MSQFQARQSGPTASGQGHHQRHSHHQQYQPQPQSAQAMYDFQFQQQQAQQAAYLAQLQLQSHLLLQQQIAQQQHALAHAMRSPPLQQSAQFGRPQQQQHFNYSHQQQPQPQPQFVGGRQQLNASRGADKRSPSASRADAAKTWHTAPATAATAEASRSSSTESSHHRRSSSGHRSTHSAKSHGSPEPPALIVSRPGEAFPDTSGSESSSVVGDGDHVEPDLDRLEKSLEQVSLAHARPSQATSLAKALSGRRQRPASLTGLASPPLGAALNVDAPAFVAPQAPVHQQRTVSDGAPLSPFANSYTPLAPVFSPTIAQFASPPIVQTPTFTNNGGNLNASGRAQAPVKGGAAALRMPKGPARGETLAESNFAGRLRRAAIAQLACSHRG